MGQICDFRPKSPFMSEMVRDRSMVTNSTLRGDQIDVRKVFAGSTTNFDARYVADFLVSDLW